MKILSRRTLLCAPLTVFLAASEQQPKWKAQVTDAKEPGERLVISGRVLRNAGGPPAAGAVIQVYQTDASGIYGKGQGHPRDIARLRAQFQAGPEGQYEIVTIKPGRYPGGGAPAHIHVNLIEPGKAPREIFEFLFAGDPSLTGKEKGYVLQLRKDAQGRWIASQDFAIDQ